MNLDKRIQFYLTLAFHAFSQRKNGMPWVDKASQRWEELNGDTEVPFDTWVHVFTLMKDKFPELMTRCPSRLSGVVALAYEQACGNHQRHGLPDTH